MKTIFPIKKANCDKVSRSAWGGDYCIDWCFYPQYRHSGNNQGHICRFYCSTDKHSGNTGFIFCCHHINSCHG